MDCNTSGLLVHHQLPELVQNHVHRVSDAIQPCHPLLLLLFLTSIFPSIRDFSKESALHIRWRKYWSFSFSISPSDEYSGLLSFRIDWFDLLAVQGTLKSFLQNQSSKTSVLSLLYGPTLTSIQDSWKKHVKGREVKSLSHVQLLATSWTATLQAPPSMGFSRHSV